MNNQRCERAEVLAGAIALGEASDAERDEYRGHIAACAPCLTSLGGEREIERVMDVVAQARDEETWEPAFVSMRREPKFARWMKYGFSLATAAVALSLGLHALLAASFGHAPPTPNNPFVIDYDGTHITLERRANAHQQKPRNEEPRVVVVHNVVTLKAPTANAQQAQQPAEKAVTKDVATTTTTTTVASNDAQPLEQKDTASQIPVWRRAAEPQPRVHRAPVTIAAAPTFEQHAESMSVSPGMSAIRDVAPVGGDAAIVPHPAAIAFAEGAEGTSVFEVAVDERGTPTKCTITRSSGFLVLDEAVCRAAMKARYTPKSINGRPVTGLYRDAFTFRSSTNTEGIDTPNPTNP